MLAKVLLAMSRERIFAAQAHVAQAAPVLLRNIDKRPLSLVARGSLSQAMQAKVAAMEAEALQAADPGRPTLTDLKTEVFRIPVAPRGHALWYVQMSGALACTGNAPNCALAVFDETARGIDTVTDDAGTGISVVRRSHLQMPDILLSVQEGHFAVSTTVFRFDGRGWSPYLCAETPITEDADPSPALSRHACTR